MTHVTCRLTAKNRDQLRNPTRSVIAYGLPFTWTNVNHRIFQIQIVEVIVCLLWGGAYSRPTLPKTLTLPCLRYDNDGDDIVILNE